MAYEITATRKRPQTFDELIGQEFVVTTLKNAIKAEHIAHAYLFSGPRGVGKTSAARILAKALNCEKGPTDSPCSLCSACLEITRGQSLDVIEIDGASNTGVNDVREIRDEVLFCPNSYRFKIYIIDEVHMLSNSAFNALLKTIEEPPPYIVFVFATTEIQKVPATIRSRCQQFNFTLISIEKIKNNLCQVIHETGIKAEEEALIWIAKEAMGSLRDAYTLLDQIISFSNNNITLKKIKEKLGIVGMDELNKMFSFFVSGKSKEILEMTGNVLAGGVSVEQFVIDIVEYFRNILFLKNGIRKEGILGYSPEMFPKEELKSFSCFQIEKAIEMLLNLYRNLRFSLNQKFELELVMAKLSKLKSMISREDLLLKIKEIRADVVKETGGSEKVAANESLEQQKQQKQNEEEKKEKEKKEEEEKEEVQNEEEKEVQVEGVVLKKKLIEIINIKKKPALASALSKAGGWFFEKNALNITFDPLSRFSEEMVKKEIKIINDAIQEIIKRFVKINIKIGLSKDLSKDLSKESVDVNTLKTGETVDEVSGKEKVKVEAGDEIVKEDSDYEYMDSRVEMVKKVFKGEVVKGGDSNEY